LKKQNRPSPKEKGGDYTVSIAKLFQHLTSAAVPPSPGGHQHCHSHSEIDLHVTHYGASWKKVKSHLSLVYKT
jgi:hypothetical protein